MLFVAILLGINSPVDAQQRATQTEPPRLRGTVDLNIGEANESREAYMFGVIGGLALDGQGRILVADRKDNNVRVFSPTGSYLYSLGRTGQGPGDLNGPCCLTATKDGLLWIKETGNHRFSVYRLGATEASFVRTVRGASNSVVSADRVDFDAKGRLVDLETAFTAATRTFRMVRLRIDSAGTVVERDTVPKPPADSLSSVTVPTGGGTASYSQPFGATELHAFGAGGEAAHAVSSRYAVVWMDTQGKRRALLQRDVPSPKLSERERSSTDSMLERIARNTRNPRANLRLIIPQTKTPLKALGFDLEGRLWIERSVVDGQPGEADVYERSGRWVAIMQWPADVRMGLWTVRGTTGLGIAVDEDGAQRVVRLKFR